MPVTHAPHLDSIDDCNLRGDRLGWESARGGWAREQSELTWSEKGVGHHANSKLGGK